MAEWTTDELSKIGRAEELQIASLRRDGTLGSTRTIWVVRNGDDLCVRSVNGPTAAWFRGTRARHDVRSWFPRFSSEARKANQPIVDLLRGIAARRNATPAQIALAWLLAQAPWIVPIPGTRKMQRMEENLGAAAIELTPGELREIDAATSGIEVHGTRGTGREQYT